MAVQCNMSRCECNARRRSGLDARLRIYITLKTVSLLLPEKEHKDGATKAANRCRAA